MSFTNSAKLPPPRPSMNHSSRLAYLLRHPVKGIYKEAVTLTGGLSPLALTYNELPLAPELADIFSRNDESMLGGSPNMYELGGSLQRERLVGAAEFCAARFAGDLVEIGAYRGETTRLLGAVARKYKRRLIVIDPWMTGSQDCVSDEHQVFLKNTEEVRDVLDVWRESSVDRAVVARLALRPLCFAFVDGWHVLHACLSDIMASGHAKGVIAIDDTRYNHDLLFTARRGARKLNRRAVLQDGWQRESYIFSDACLIS
jgi:hypothetical protein